MAHRQDVPLYRVHVKGPPPSIPTGPAIARCGGTPSVKHFEPAAVRVVPASEIRAGDVPVGVCQLRHDRRSLEALPDRLQFVWYFAHTPTAQLEDARPFDGDHCDTCAANEFYMRLSADGGCTVLDGCSVYAPGTLLRAVPRELAVG
ncbi:hypothetical protein ACWGJT_03225 [Streptomyces xantholiticus]